MKKNILSKAIETLKDGKVVIYPTDTLYAMGADIFNECAVRKIFEIKKRPFDIPIPVAVSSIVDLERIAYLNYNAKKLIDNFLPGFLTLVLFKKSCVPDIVTSNLNKIAIRIPNNDIALELISNFGPLTVTSANIHGFKTPDVIKDIDIHFKGSNVGVYLDYGKLSGKPSTIVDVSNKIPKILREGVILKNDILAVLYD